MAIHVAGVIQVGHADTVTLGHFHDAVDTMLWGPVHLALAVLPHMRDAGHGRIGIVSSVGGLVAVPRLVPYSVAKFGAVGLAEGLYAELAGTGVTVTAVTPGLMRTGGHTHARFVDDAVTDYAWFAPLASLPGLSISAERAARRIVSGVVSGSPTVELTPADHRRASRARPGARDDHPGDGAGQPAAARAARQGLRPDVQCRTGGRWQHRASAALLARRRCSERARRPGRPAQQRGRLRPPLSRVVHSTASMLLPARRV